VAIDDSIQGAVQIGEKNKHIIELARNWCAHLEVQQSGGVGLVEVYTGLPIGMRSFKCAYARAAGFAGMDLEYIALDFHDRNCADCSQRVPVRFPNLSEIVGARDAARQQASAAQTRAAEEAANALAARATRRSELAQGGDPARTGIFTALDEFDRQPTDHNRQVLVATATAASGQFDSSVQEALYDLAEAGGFTRTEGSLEVLMLIGARQGRFCATALRALARGDGLLQAALVVQQYLGKENEAELPAALPALIMLASPVRAPFPVGEQSASDSRPLIAAFRVFPDLVLTALRERLQSSDKHVRIQACDAISSIVEIDSSFGLKLVDDLVRSMYLPDDRYDEGPAERVAANTIAEVMLSYPHEVDSRIQLEDQTASTEMRAALLDIYEQILRTDRNTEIDRKADPACEISYQRFVDLLLSLPANELLSKADWFLQNEATRFPLLLERHAETLVGAAALIAAELEVPQSPIVNLSLKPDPLKAIEAQSRLEALHFTLRAILQPVGILASRKPGTVGKLLLASFDGVGDEHEYFKAGLVSAIGYMATMPAGSALALPPLYRAMTNQLARVRAAAAKAYSQLAKKNPDDLPSLVHETFLLLLTDPYVIVHTAAVEALREVRLPTEFTDRVIRSLWNIVGAYSKDRSNDRLLSEFLERLLRVLARTDKSLIDRPTQQVILSIVRNMNVRWASRFVADNGHYLRGCPEFGTLLLRLIGDADLDEYVVEDLVAEVAEVGPGEILQISADFRAAAKTRASSGSEVTDEFIEILTAAGAWSVAMDIARDSTDRLTDSAWDRPRKLRSEARQIATALEGAAAESNAESVIELTRGWRSVEEQISKDNAEHKKRRDPLFDLRLPDRGE
jgi:hypothetical protein